MPRRLEAVDGERFAKNLTHGHARIERTEGILEHCLDLPTLRAHCLTGHLRKVDAVEKHAPLGRTLELHNQSSERGLSGSALADKSEGLTARDVQETPSTALNGAEPRLNRPRPT